jgi:enoyl-CoA hydratase
VDLRRSLDDGVLTVTFDDGAKNVLNPDAFAALSAALDEEPDAQAVVLAGREGILSAGLDLKYMMANGRDGTRELLVAFGRCLMRWWTDPRPTVCAATGHAIAAGTMFAMACDHAIAAEGSWWGLTETQIDFELPLFAIALARANVRADRLEDLLLPGARIDATAACEAGYADELVPPDQVVARAQAHARELATLPPRAYAGTKQRLRGQEAAAVLAGLDDDITALTSHLVTDAGSADG